MLAHGQKCRRQCIGRVGVISINRRALIYSGKLHAAGDALQSVAGTRHLFEIQSAMQTQPHGNFQIFDLKITDQRYMNIGPLAGFFNHQHHAVGRTRGDRNFERRIRTADRINLASFSARGRRQIGGRRPAHLHNSHACRLQNFGKQAGLGFKITRHVAVIIHMVAGKIGKARNIAI